MSPIFMEFSYFWKLPFGIFPRAHCPCVKKRVDKMVKFPRVQSKELLVVPDWSNLQKMLTWNAGVVEEEELQFDDIDRNRLFCFLFPDNSFAIYQMIFIESSSCRMPVRRWVFELLRGKLNCHQIFFEPSFCRWSNPWFGQIAPSWSLLLEKFYPNHATTLFHVTCIFRQWKQHFCYLKCKYLQRPSLFETRSGIFD